MAQGGGPGFDSAIASDAEPPDRFDDAGGVLGDSARLPGQDLAGGGFGVDRVALAAAGPRMRMGLVDLDDADTGLEETAGKSRPIACRRLDPDRHHRSVRLQPWQGLAVAVGRVVECESAEQPTKKVEDDAVWASEDVGGPGD